MVVSPSPGARKASTVAVFVLAVTALFVYVGEVVTHVSGGVVAQAPVEGVSAEAGEAVYFGKGKCSTCHSIGDRGSAIRGPNHGVSAQFDTPMGLRAEERARERSQATGRPFTATEYLVESIVDPGAYVVSGYKNEMPLVYRPPIALKPDEVRAVILFLQSLGGEVSSEAIKLPETILRAADESRAAPWAPYLKGDPQAGAALFFDEESKAGCARCHTVNGRGRDVGPELSTVAGTRTPQFIVESILQPSAVIASGFEPYLVETRDGRYRTGVLKARNDRGLTLKTERGELLIIPAADIREVAPQETSIMPGSFADDLSLTQFHDVLAFLLTLTGEDKEAAAGKGAANGKAQASSAGGGHAR
ncbi:MAG: c-type cytochrome [Candidatus Lambdaproteobacteria bacterium]|nr:c-type cytochrome [Candidatus Lambdaproteobacteria bacterium]